MTFGRRPSGTDSPGAPRGLIHTIIVLIMLGVAVWRIIAMLSGNAHRDAEPAGRDVAAVPSAPFEPDLSRLKRFPNVTVTWYDVPGTNPRAISDYIATHGPIDTRDGFRATGTTTWRMNWQYPGGANGGCDTTRVRMTFAGTVLLPRLTQVDRLTPRARAAWGKTLQSLIAHEEGHLHIAYSQMESVAQAIRHSSCADARAAADAVFARINGRNAEYDRETRHGLVESEKFPTL